MLRSPSAPSLPAAGLVLAVLLLGGAGVQAQPIGNYTPPKQALRLELQAGQRLYRPGDSVSLVVRFLNQGTEPITFTEPGDYLSGLEIWRVTDGKPEQLKRPGPGGTRGASQTLAPEKAFEKTLDLGGLLKEEGAYQFGWSYEFAGELKPAQVGLWGEPDPRFRLRQFLRPAAARMTTCALWSAATLDRIKNTLAVFETTMGKLTIEFYPEDAPVTVATFQNVVRSGGYDNRIFHRVIKGFMMQGGDPRGDGTGDAGYKLAQEFNDRDHAPGTLSMARSAGPDSAGCQFFICFGAPPHLKRAYTLFGAVLDGMDTVKAVESVRTFGAPTDRPIEDVVLTKATLIKRPER